MYVTVERAASPLKRVVWRFWVTLGLSGIEIWLDQMHDEMRPTKRHRKWETLHCWYRLHPGRHCPGLLKEVPTPPADVVADAEEKVVYSIRFVPGDKGKR